MKPLTRGPARSRSHTHMGRRPRRSTRLYAEAPVALRSRKALRLPRLDGQRAAAVVALIGLTVILLSLFVLPDYRIKAIDVKGNQGTATQDIRESAAFVEGRSAFLVRAGDVAAAVKSLPGIEEARAHIVLPDRVEIVVKDTPPEVAWVSGNLVAWVDKNGVVRDQPPPEQDKRITIRDLTGRIYEKGDKVDVYALQAAQQLSVLMQRELQSFEVPREGELVLVSSQGWRALFNARGDLNGQVAALRRVIGSGRAVAYVDVRVPSLVSYK